MVGRTLLHYRVLEKIGAGGMGVVYRAHDEKLDRDAALKVLPAGALADEAARKRFQQEALALSHLNHPNICTIYEIGEAEGQTYIAMEFVKGRSLSAMARGEGLAAETAVRYGAQIADALVHAHERGVVHRDLKSSNVIVTPAGRAKVLDFGLAKRLHEGRAEEATRTQGSLTEAGTVVGTLHYIAPEVLEGGLADGRSDIWALGVVLYEMATGRLPFEGQTAFAVSSAILREPPAPLPERVPAGLRGVIQRCLAKEPAQRYQTAAEVRAVLEAASSGVIVAAAAPPRTAARRWVLAAAAVAAIALVIAALLGLNVGRLRDRTMGRSGAPRIESLAVLPLENFSRDPEQEFFADGMTEQLITDLSKIGALRVISRTSVMQYKGKHKPLPEIAKELKVDSVVEGSVLQSGNRVRITAQLLYAPTDKHLWAESYDRDLRDVLALQGEVARSIADQIRITLTAQEQARLGARPQVDPEVFQLYLRGQYFANQKSLEQVNKGIGYFEQAIAKDPSYAPAHAGLALAYSGLSSIYAAPHEVMPKAKAEAVKALELDDGLSEAHTALATVRMFYEWDWDGAEKELQRAIKLNPSSAEAYHLYGEYFNALNRLEPAERELERAHELDPLSLAITGDLLAVWIADRQYDRVIGEARKVVASHPDSAFAHAWMGMAYVQKKQFPEAIAAIQKARSLEPSYTMDHFLAVVLAAAGNKAEARKLAAKLDQMAQRQYVCAYEVAEVHVALGDNDTAYKWMQRGVKEQCDCLVWLKTEPWMDPLRVDPRYLKLVKRVFGER